MVEPYRSRDFMDTAPHASMTVPLSDQTLGIASCFSRYGAFETQC